MRGVIKLRRESGTIEDGLRFRISIHPKKEDASAATKKLWPGSNLLTHRGGEGKLVREK